MSNENNPKLKYLLNEVINDEFTEYLRILFKHYNIDSLKNLEDALVTSTLFTAFAPKGDKNVQGAPNQKRT